MFTHLSVLKVLFFFSTRPCHSSLFPPVLLFSSPSLFPTSRYFGVYPFLFSHSQSLLGILYSRIFLMCPYQFNSLYLAYSTTEFLTFISFLITVFLIFTNLECLADLLKKSISIDINFDVKFLFSFQISAP